MGNNKEEILALLEAEGVAYQLVEHPPAADMPTVERLGVNRHAHVAKNLFLRDSRKGVRHILVTVCGDKQVDIRKLGERLGTRLSFASEKRLAKYLRLETGSVTPLAVCYDTDNAVEVYLDEALAEKEAIGVHPGVNTATVFLAFSDIVKIVKKCGNKVEIIKI